MPMQPPLAIDLAIDEPRWRDKVKDLDAIAGRTLQLVWSTLGHQLPQAPECEVSLLFTDNQRIAQLNASYRGKDKPTNVLSFPAFADDAPAAGCQMIGDIALALGVIESEAVKQDKTITAHLSHLLIHGMLHLLGYDHEDDDEADEMETVERQLLAELGFADPYAPLDASVEQAAS